MSPHWEQFIYTYPDLIAEMIYTCSDHIINKPEKMGTPDNNGENQLIGHYTFPMRYASMFKREVVAACSKS